MKTILMTEKEYGKAGNVVFNVPELKVLPAAAEERELAENILQYSANCVVVGVENYTGLLYDALYDVAQTISPNAPFGGLIARFGVGHDGIDKMLARQRRIAVTNTPGVLTRSVAEHTFWLMGTLLRHIVKGDRAMRDGAFPSYNGFELYGKTLLVIGIGEIGKHVARIASHGFGMRVYATDRHPLEELAQHQHPEPRHPEDWLREHGIERYSADVGVLLPEADIVSLHLASTAETRHIISTPRLALMKPGAVLINTSRGPVVDEAALFEALSSGNIAGAALDVFETEPYYPVTESADLRTLNNVVLTPHLGSSSVEANRRMGESVLKNIRLFHEGRFDEMNMVSR